VNRRIVKTEAVVLKRMDYLESSRIVTLFTKEEGKISVLAKGARSRSNRFGSALEPGAVVQVVYYSKANRELQTLTQAEVVERFRDLTSSMAKLTGALHMLDLAHAVTDPGHRHPEFYELLVSALRAVNVHEAGLAAVLLGYRLKLSHISGLSPGLGECVNCGRQLRGARTTGPVVFDIRRGGVVCSRCAGTGADRSEYSSPSGGRIRIDAGKLLRMQGLLDAEFDTYENMTLPDGLWNELDGILRLYERHHVLHGRTLKTESMVREFIA
jgi:DNA repair protein RecO (recombination protein O)